MQPESHVWHQKCQWEQSRDWQSPKHVNRGFYDRKCWTTSQEVLVPSTPQVGYKEAILPWLDLQFSSMHSMWPLFLFRGGCGVKTVLSSFKQLYLLRGGREKREGELLTNLEFIYKEKCAWKATFQSQDLHRIQQFFQHYRIHRYISLTVTFSRLQTPPHYWASFPTINEGAVKRLGQITATPSNAACRGAQHICILQHGEKRELCFLYETKR